VRRFQARQRAKAQLRSLLPLAVILLAFVPTPSSAQRPGGTVIGIAVPRPLPICDSYQWAIDRLWEDYREGWITEDEYREQYPVLRAELEQCRWDATRP